MKQARLRNRRSGSTIIEFALVSLIIIPCCLGVVGIGMTMGNFIKVLQTTRDTAHMFARGIEFDSVENRDIVVRLATTLGMTRNGGIGVIILSKVITPRQEDCDAASVDDCRNQNLPVIMHRLTIGNPALRTSRYGTPNSQLITADGNIRASDYLVDASVRAANFSQEMATAGIVQQRGEIAYIVEGYFTLPNLRFLGYAPEGGYCRFVF